ncbi:MAG: tyrosine--tRNA ligase [Roseiflexaceae bacterium]|nr:tyrosine--tRNA ligase [Roseiflexaceae bacterium]
MPDVLDELLTRGVAEVVVEKELRAKLQSGKKLRLKQGFDPTKPDMHIGHAVGLRKLRKFQELGHQVVLIVGDWTAQIGDPSGRDETRPRLTAEIVQENAHTYMRQFFTVVDEAKTEVRWQSEWFGNFTLLNALDLAGRFTLGQMLAHDTFRKRYEEGARLSILELMYPMLQGYDSVAVKSDVEFGGTDQKFNNLAGRELQEQWGQTPQDILLLPLIPGTDGRKMGKSFNNTIDVLLPPFEMYSKVLSMTDGVMPLYYEVLTDVPLDEVREMQRAMAAGAVNPMEFKMRLAREVVDQFHPAGQGSQAEGEWVRRFREKEQPSEIANHAISGPISIVDFLAEAGLAPSKSEARRLIAGGGVRVEGEKVDADFVLSPERPAVVQVGKRKFIRAVRE